MYRTIINQLKEWKNKKYRKPLVLAGARQVGKTFMLTESGKQEFENVAYINCDDNNMARERHPGFHGIRFSMSDYREQDWMTNIPLYAASIYFLNWN